MKYALAAICAPLVLLGAALPASAQPSPAAQPGTAPGLLLGIEGYGSNYNEPGHDNLSGPFFGATGTYNFKRGPYFLSFDGRADIGYLNSSSGKGDTDGLWNFEGEFRPLLGVDLPINPTMTFSPYAGLGYRIVYDNQDQTSAGGAASPGFDRTSQYFYVPIGASLEMTSGNWHMTPNVEFDYLVQGWQSDHLQQIGYDSSLYTHQNDGYGLRGSLYVGTGPLTFGPFIRYWNIRQSSSAPLLASGSQVGSASVPQNDTVEAGMGMKFQF